MPFRCEILQKSRTSVLKRHSFACHRSPPQSIPSFLIPYKTPSVMAEVAARLSAHISPNVSSEIDTSITPRRSINGVSGTTNGIASGKEPPTLLSALRGSRAALARSQSELQELEGKATQFDRNDEQEQEQDAEDDGIVTNGDDEDFSQAFKDKMKKSSKKMFDMLRNEASIIEEGVQRAEGEVIRRMREAFQLSQNDRLIMREMELQASELNTKDAAFKNQMNSRAERKVGKIAQRKIMRDTKARDTQIIALELANSQLDIVNETLKTKRKLYDARIEQIESTHSKQLRQLPQAQQRRLACDKELLQMEMLNIKDEVIRQSMLKKFRMRTVHQKATDKRVTDQLLAFQAVELRQAKERFELGVQQFEAEQEIVAKDLHSVSQLQVQQTRELNAEKERLLVLRETTKLKVMKMHHDEYMKRTGHNNRLKLRKMKSAFDKDIKAAAEMAGVTTTGSSVGGTSSNSQAQSAFHSTLHSTLHSGIATPTKSRGMSRSGSEDSIATGDSLVSTDTANTEDLNELNVDADEDIVALVGSIATMVTAQRLARRELRKLNKAAATKTIMIAEERRKQLAMQHGPELEQLVRAQQLELSTARAVQEKEIAMEESVHDAEANALLERKTLNYVLNAVGDGIVNMSPTGRITRVNQATELMFGYDTDDVIGRDIRMLVPVACRKNGKGVVVEGKRKDGKTFPCHVAVSEVVADGVHLFTGILRDVTQERTEQAHAQAVERARQVELMAAKNQADELLQRMFPPTVAQQLLSGVVVDPENFAGATVFFSDVVGFTEIASRCSAIQMVDFLNDLYSAFDGIISLYDAYKVETIGDCYMVVSGCPKPNGDLHAGEIARMALHLVSAVQNIKFKGQPDLKIQIRVGICTGPVAAGVVGSKMPRYCLFGNTVNVASRMESNGKAMHIHCTESTFTALQRLGGYNMQLRGSVDIKGKGKMQTYWLTGKEGFEHGAPTPTAD
ncbi:adenylate and guanylate cyclase catalytic domain-containing protein [Fimicolochytrium jonesii]|uniref:adenylate and guanylate cyclase catalytic domain-containing protein n=1 Tax=Fimicolochytrium jonesii TaxID=1396493 RepID=UPI0022FEFA7C|nr:adenylate and guanylate cyclase catalytic domain-containing protein [Fimicolochytrium jonesii]KAI8815768.1 adenylate and guanylate cyclase catalytic domain-containing protein [Fimicolochytrium jonesii]